MTIGDTFTPKRGRRFSLPFTVRQMHRPDRVARVEFADGTRGMLAFAAIRKHYRATGS